MDSNQQQLKKGVSVIICCYNSSSKLLPTLQHLAAQTKMSGLEYELIIVDNNCTDDSVALAKHTWQQLSTPFAQKIITQKKAGLNFARQAGISSALYPIVVLCDDDNWLCEHYLQTVFSLFEKMPQVGMIGGVGEAVSDIPLPTWFDAVKGFGYAVGTEGRYTGYTPSVYGAGMALRRDLFSKLIIDNTIVLSDRKGESLSSGGDSEIAKRFYDAGYHIYLDETLTFKHFLLASRLQWSYYLSLRKSFGKANAQLYGHQNGLSKMNKIRAVLSLLKFGVKHTKYWCFPSFFKVEACAAFVQQYHLRKALLMAANKTDIPTS